MKSSERRLKRYHSLSRVGRRKKNENKMMMSPIFSAISTMGACTGWTEKSIKSTNISLIHKKVSTTKVNIPFVCLSLSVPFLAHISFEIINYLFIHMPQIRDHFFCSVLMTILFDFVLLISFGFFFSFDRIP